MIRYFHLKGLNPTNIKDELDFTLREYPLGERRSGPDEMITLEMVKKFRNWYWMIVDWKYASYQTW